MWAGFCEGYYGSWETSIQDDRRESFSEEVKRAEVRNEPRGRRACDRLDNRKVRISTNRKLLHGSYLTLALSVLPHPLLFWMATAETSPFAAGSSSQLRL